MFNLNAGVAQSVEQLPCKQKVVGSIPIAGTIIKQRLSYQFSNAQLVELVDMEDSKSSAERRAGSSPALGTKQFMAGWQIGYAPDCKSE